MGDFTKQISNTMVAQAARQVMMNFWPPLKRNWVKIFGQEISDGLEEKNIVSPDIPIIFKNKSRQHGRR
jgi:hypothetical protein